MKPIVNKSLLRKQAKKIKKSVSDLFALEIVVANGTITPLKVIEKLQRIQNDLIAANKLWESDD